VRVLLRCIFCVVEVVASGVVWSGETVALLSSYKACPFLYIFMIFFTKVVSNIRVVPHAKRQRVGTLCLAPLVGKLQGGSFYKMKKVEREVSL